MIREEQEYNQSTTTEVGSILVCLFPLALPFPLFPPNRVLYTQGKKVSRSMHHIIHAYLYLCTLPKKASQKNFMLAKKLRHPF